MAEVLKNVVISDEIMRLGPDSNSMTTVDMALETLPLEQSLISDLVALREEAHQAGFSQGLLAGEAQACALITDQTAALTALLTSIPDAISNHRLQTGGEIADIVLLVVQQFFISQQHSHDAIAAQITQTLTQINHRENIELCLHPADLALLQQGRLNIDLKSCKQLRITADESLRLGGCLIKSEHGTFDASIERQIDRLKQVLLQIKREKTV